MLQSRLPDWSWLIVSESTSSLLVVATVSGATECETGASRWRERWKLTGVILRSNPVLHRSRTYGEFRFRGQDSNRASALEQIQHRYIEAREVTHIARYDGQIVH